MVAARAREGQRLKEILELRCASLEEQVAAGAGASARGADQAAGAPRTKGLKELIGEVGSGTAWSRSSPCCCSGSMSTRSSIASAGHIQEIRRVLAANEPAGRRLDFLMQELNREANTLSSKSRDLETTRSAVDMKVLHRADAGAGAERRVIRY